MHALVLLATLTMRQLDSSSVHLADQRGAINYAEDTTVTVELRANGTLVASVTGKRSQHDLYADGNNSPSYNTDDVTTWKTSWTGSFKRSSDTLELVLVLRADTCSRIKTSDGVAPQKLACTPAAKRTTATCTTTQVELDDPSGSAKPRSVDAWTCTPTSVDDLGESPRWLLGKTACIAIIGGHKTRTTYRRC